MTRVYGFDEEGYRRVREATRRALGAPRTGAQRRRQNPVLSGGSGGDGDCSCLTVVEVRCDGLVVGGTFDLGVAVHDGSTLTYETISDIDWDTNAADFKTALETHSKIAGTDIQVKGGPFPNTALYIVFLQAGTLNRHQNPPYPDSTDLTGGGVVKTALVSSANWS